MYTLQSFDLGKLNWYTLSKHTTESEAYHEMCSRGGYRKGTVKYRIIKE